jgi:hypothetical protein
MSRFSFLEKLIKLHIRYGSYRSVGENQKPFPECCPHVSFLVLAGVDLDIDDHIVPLREMFHVEHLGRLEIIDTYVEYVLLGDLKSP